jgi:glycosyltransferase involved in cell wall biosynthesis
MPVYNRQAYIPRAIESVFNQSYKEWELVTVDDGSQDYSASILETYRTKSPKIKIIYQAHQNLPAARNNGIKNSKGNLITFIDSDDEYKQNHLELRVKHLASNPEIDFLHGGVEIIGNEFVPDKNDRSKLIHLSQCAIGATFFGKKIVFEKLGGFKDIEYSEDSEFLERVIKNYNVKKVDFPTYVYHRETPDSITNTLS